jgi:hypothetical protein
VTDNLVFPQIHAPKRAPSLGVGIGTNLTPGPADVWALDSNAYSPDKFYVKSTDGRGNSELLNVKVSPFVYGILAELVESPLFPDYRTKADVIRDMLVHRLHYVREMVKDEARMAGLKQRTWMLQQEAQVERLKNEMLQEQSYTEALIEAMQLGIQGGNVTMTAQSIEAAQAALDALPFHLADKLRKEIGLMDKEYRVMQARAAIDAEELERHA